MSQEALVLAVRDRLRTELVYREVECDIQPEGQPPPGAGELYVGIDLGDVRNEGVNSFQELYGCEVVVSLRGSRVPRDRWSKVLYLDAARSLDKLLRDIRSHLHRSYQLLNAANVLLAEMEPGTNGFLEPLRYEGRSKPRIVGPDWWWAEPTREHQTGMTVTGRFTGMKRVQKFE